MFVAAVVGLALLTPPTGGPGAREATLRNAVARRIGPRRDPRPGDPDHHLRLIVDFPQEHSLSGVSAGGSMVAQHLVAYSDVVTGGAIIAGSAYGCGSLGPDYDNTCNCENAPAVSNPQKWLRSSTSTLRPPPTPPRAPSGRSSS